MTHTERLRAKKDIKERQSTNINFNAGFLYKDIEKKANKEHNGNKTAYLKKLIIDDLKR